MFIILTHNSNFCEKTAACACFQARVELVPPPPHPGGGGKPSELEGGAPGAKARHRIIPYGYMPNNYYQFFVVIFHLSDDPMRCASA